MNIKNFHHPDIHIDNFSSIPGATWCFYGDNLSGIDRFAPLIGGELVPSSAEMLNLPEKTAILTFARQQQVYENELRNDDTDFLDRIDPGTLVRDFFTDLQEALALVETFKLLDCLDRGYRQLSSGQCRKLHLIEQLIRKPETIVIQNPYEGLDQEGRKDLDNCLQLLPEQGVELILLVNRFTDIPRWCSHLGLFAQGQLISTGERRAVLPLILQNIQKQLPPDAALQENLLTKPKDEPRELIRLHNGHAAYGDRVLFTGLDLTVETGDHTLISGPNGCGKSTLLDIITGDNPKCYMNNLTIFGRKRGTGESIWELKKHMGIVSPGLHRAYRAPGSLLHVILSGLHDSIGLYRPVHSPEIRLARQWLSLIGLGARERRSFHAMNYAEQRLVLICRALIKMPQLLILDEPSQGLDDHYREVLLNLLDEVAKKELSTILFVSHRQDEWRPFFTQHLQLESFAPARQR